MTLRFLGEIAPALQAPLAAQVRAQTAGACAVRAAAGRARELSAGAPPARAWCSSSAPGEPLAALAGAVERGVVAAGFAPETRAFRAHLTLGRMRERGTPPSLAALTVPPGRLFDVTESVLFASELHPSGSRYTPLERVPLGGAGGGRLQSSHHP